MKRSRTLGVALLAAAALLAPAPLTHADSVTVTADDLLNGRLVESWGACDMPGGWLTVHHDGWTSAGAGVGMRLFEGTTADAVVTHRWSRLTPSGKTPDRHDCVSADFDRNGLMDFYVTAGRGSSNATKEDGRGNELWLQQTPGVWRNRAASWGVEDVCGRSHYAATADFNTDGWADLYVGNATPRDVTPDPCDLLPGSETAHLYINREGTQFRDATAAWGLAGDGGVRFAEAGQFLGHPRPDLVVSRPTGMLVLKNVGGKFVDRRAALGIPATDWAQAAVEDVDQNGVMDLVTATNSNVAVRPGFSGQPMTVLTSTLVRGVATNPRGDIYVVRSNLWGDTNPQDVVLVRDSIGWTPAVVPNASGLGDFAFWSTVAQAWIVGNGLEDHLGPLQFVRASLEPTP